MEWHVLCPVLVVDLLSYFWKAVSLRGAVSPCFAMLMRTAAPVGHPGSLQATDRVAGHAADPPPRRLCYGRQDPATEIQTVARGTLVGFLRSWRLQMDLHVRRRPSCKAPCRCRLPGAPYLPTSLFEFVFKYAVGEPWAGCQRLRIFM